MAGDFIITISNLDKAINDVKTYGLQVNPYFTQNAISDPNSLITNSQELQKRAYELGQISTKMLDLADQYEHMAHRIASTNREMGVDQSNAPNNVNQGYNMSDSNNIKASSFNLHKYKIAQALDKILPEDMFESADSMENYEQEQQYINEPLPHELYFNSHADLKTWLDGQGSFRTAADALEPQVYGDDELEVLRSALETFYSPDITDQPDFEEVKLDAANDIYEVLTLSRAPENSIVTNYTSASKYNQIVKESESLIKNYVDNLKVDSTVVKTAQLKGLDNVIVHGPDGTRWDYITRQPISDYHILERNKGWGFNIPGVQNVDFESFWRQFVMDKYTADYMDANGNWVGGYINKRFEVDRNIPVDTNIRYRPGETRKTILPQYGSTESRLQHARHADSPKDNDAPFDWNTASSSSSYNLFKESSKKKAHLEPLKSPFDGSKTGPKGIWDSKNIKPQYGCKMCGSQIKSPNLQTGEIPSVCSSNCHYPGGPFSWAEVAVPVTYKNAPNEKGQSSFSYHDNEYIVPNQRVASSSTDSEESDEDKDKKKKKIYRSDDLDKDKKNYISDDEFKQANADVQVVPTDEEDEDYITEEEASDMANILGIDG